MANWCSNTVEFRGRYAQDNYLKVLFETMALKEKKERRGQLPAFAADQNSGYFFSVSWEEGILHYMTKWSPNTAVLVLIADHFGADFIYRYSEPGNLVYGEVVYEKGGLREVALDFDDTALYEYDEETDSWYFENRNDQSQDEILGILLDRKIAAVKARELNNGLQED